MSPSIRSLPKWTVTLSAEHYCGCHLKGMFKMWETGKVCISVAAKQNVDTPLKRAGMSSNLKPHLANYHSIWVTELISARG